MALKKDHKRSLSRYFIFLLLSVQVVVLKSDKFKQGDASGGAFIARPILFQFFLYQERMIKITFFVAKKKLVTLAIERFWL